MGNKVAIDEEIYNGISSNISGLSESLNGVDLSPCFSGELASFYSGSCDTDLESQLSKSVTKIENTALAIDASINAYKTTDEDLAYGLDMMIDAMFAEDFSSMDNEFIPYEGDDESGGSLTLEERKEYLDNLIKSYEQLLKTLESEFEEKYGRGTVPYNKEDFRAIWPVLYGMGFKIDNLAKFDNTGRISINTINDIVTFCESEKVFERTIDYFNGGSYKDTIGKIDFGDGMCDDPNNTEEDWRDAEIEFLSLVASCYDDINISRDPSQMENNKLLVKNKLIQDNIIRLSGNGKYEFTNLNFIENGKKELEEYYNCVNDIQTLKSTIYNYKQARKLIVFQSYLDDEEFKEFLNGEFEDEYLLGKYTKLLGDKSKGLSDEDIALYAFFMEHKSKEMANEYLNALEDKINSFKGMEEAIEYINKHYQDGCDFWDLLNIFLNGEWDGLVGFTEGFGKLINPTKARTVLDYKIMYLLEILSNPDDYKELGLKDIKLTDNDKKTLRRIYKVGNGVGNMLIPQLICLAGIATGNLEVVGICQKVSLAILGASVAGKAVNEAVLQGHDLFFSYLYGGLTGASEALFEKLGGIIGLADGQSLLQVSGLWSFIKEYFKSSFREGVEEFFQEYFDAGLRAILLGEPFDLADVSRDALVAGLYGMAVAGVMNSSTVLIRVGTKVYRIAASALANINLDFLDTDLKILDFFETNNIGLTPTFNANELQIIDKIISKFENKIPSYLKTPEAKLNYLFRMGYLRDSAGNYIDELYNIIDSETIQNILKNPEQLVDMYKEMSRIYKNYKNDPNFQMNDSDFYSISNLLYILSTMRTVANNDTQVLSNGMTVKQMLTNLASWSDAFGVIVMKQNSTVYEVTTSSGKKVKVNVYGVDAANVQTKLKQVQEVLNKLPQALQKTFSELDFIIVTDESGYYLNAQLNFNRLGFKGSGGYNLNNFIILTDPNSLYHELGHALDAKINKIVHGTKGYITDSWWKQIYEEEGATSEYGKNNVNEDFADSMRAYLTDPDTFRAKYPKKFELIQRLLQMSDPDTNLTSVEETQKLIEFLRSKGVDEETIAIYERHLNKLKNKQ